MICFNKETLRDKIYACWVGKNIGGTMGAPYEGTRELLDIQGFSTEPGVVLPNDDLDLQLVWLRAMDEMGPEAVNEQVLGEYWLEYVGPAWNEYGIGKSNMREGLLPPLSGEVYNEEWKHSNGAWIRTEIWASLFPGMPERAVRYAYYDACVDHGFNEGTYAAIFVAALESAAYIYNDLNTLLNIGLSKIPADCRVAKAVNLVREEHAKGTDWKVVRNMLVEQSADIGWFQAPANVAYVVLGLLYGNCDFKKSMILALNCGDDTDCTGATLGSILGIMYGTAGIPADWSVYIGDAIVTMCNLNGHGRWPKTCTELTDCVMKMLPLTTRDPIIPGYYNGYYGAMKLAYGTPRGWRPQHSVCIGNVDDFSQVSPEDYVGDQFVQEMFNRSHTAIHQAGISCDVWVELNGDPEIKPLGSISGKVTVKLLRLKSVKHYHLRWLLPEGWTVSGKSNVSTVDAWSDNLSTCTAEFTITAGEKVEPNNRLVLEVSSVQRPTCVYIPVMILG